MGAYEDMNPAVEGMQADSGNSYNESGRVASGIIKFGKAVALTTDGKKLKNVTVDTDKIMGLSVQIHNEKGYYETGEAVTYKRQGRIWCQASTTLVTPTEGGKVYVDMSDAEKRLTDTDDSGANPIIETAVFRCVDVTDGLVLVEINLP